MRNKLTDLNNYLWEELERLEDEQLTEQDLLKELKRAKAISSISKSIIGNAKTILESTRYLQNEGYVVNTKDSLKILGMKDE